MNELIAEDIVELKNKFYPPKRKLEFGQLSSITISYQDDKPRLGQRREEYKQETVELPYITEKDIELKRQKISKTEHDLFRIERLTKAAKEQGALLTVEKLAAILNRSTATISKRIQEYYEDNDDVLPLKGYIFDMGLGTTDKRIILELYQEGKEAPDIARETDHSLGAVGRYIKDYERVRLLVRRGIDSAQVQYMKGRGSSVVKQYIKIIERYYPYEIKDEE